LEQLKFFPFRIPNLSTFDEKTKKEYVKIVVINEDQHYSVLSNSWSESDYFSSENPTKSVEDIFDPTLAMGDGTKFWIVDFESGKVDGYGWTYGKSYKDIEKGNCAGNVPHSVFCLLWQNVQLKNSKKNQHQRQDPTLSQ
jgi:hypothetical protein